MLQKQTFEIWEIPGFLTMTPRGDCTICETYAAHAIVAARSLTVAILSHQIELLFQTAWPQVMTCIEDDTMDNAHGKLSWYWDQYEEATKSIKALEEKLSSEKDCHHKAKTKQFKLETELNNLQKEVKTLGKNNVGCIYASYPQYKSNIFQRLFNSFKFLSKHQKLLKNIFLNFSVFLLTFVRASFHFLFYVLYEGLYFCFHLKI